MVNLLPSFRKIVKKTGFVKYPVFLIGKIMIAKSKKRYTIKAIFNISYKGDKYENRVEKI